ncbi:peptide ABC transporter substrate-binding protein [Lactobacillus sp. PV037]|uniref:peptide ABC transporter substrate-binding protein n=1 Tax=Lactobacillus sp. PV037 TaxID=2594496 RepID=UPI00224015F5|nr:peptide ABC transporter substrate-binding protein [Lactobacillus sp. PV037]QNQ83691.1 peptide ABC transporter substrate-binding protein [Lactobacillus sp. PV037]
MKVKQKLGVVTLVAISLLAAGCSKQNSKDETKNSELNWATTGEITTLDASKVADTASMGALVNMGEGLYRIDKTGKPKLALADKVTVSKDKKHYDFYLRKTKWANNEDLTAEDFVTTYRRISDPKTKSSSMGLMGLFKNGKDIVQGKKKVTSLGVSAPSKYHLHFDLQVPNTMLKEYLSLPSFYPQNSRILKKAGSRYGTSSKYFVANGPFKIKKWDPNQKNWVLIKNENYWDKKHVHLKKINVQSNASTITSYNLYQAGKSDNTFLDSSQIAANEKKKEFHDFPTYAITRMDFNFKNKALKNLKIRQAIAAAINRHELLKSLHSTSKPLLGLIPENYNKNPKTGTPLEKDAYVKEAVTYNLQRAKQLWSAGKKEENLKNLELTVLSDDSSAGEETAEYIQSNLSELPGLTVKVRHVPLTQQLALTAAKNYDLNIYSTSTQIPSAIDLLNNFKSTTPQSPGWDNKEYDSLLTDAINKNGADPIKQYQDYVKAEKLLMKQQVTIPLFEINNSVLIKSKVKGYIFMPNYLEFDFKSVYVN